MLPQKHRLRTSAEFTHALRSGARYGSRNVVVFSADLPDAEKPTTVGFLVSKKVGNAVVRNQVKRRLRALSAAVVAEHPQGRAFVVRALPPVTDLDFTQLQRDFSSAVRGSLAKAARRRR